MAVRSAKLSAGELPQGVIGTIYTCPPGSTVILKTINVGGASSGDLLRVFVVDSITGARTKLLEFEGTSSLAFTIFQTWVVLEAGDELQGEDVASAAGTYWLSGAVLPSA